MLQVHPSQSCELHGGKPSDIDEGEVAAGGGVGGMEWEQVRDLLVSRGPIEGPFHVFLGTVA